MVELADYRDKYQFIKLTRDQSGILEVRLHTDGDSLRWGAAAHREFTSVFRQIALDRGNRVVIITGTGEEFLGPRADAPGGKTTSPAMMTFAEEYEMWEKDGFIDQPEMNNALLDIQVPVIAAVNGPARRHCEVPLYSDIVIASEDASFEDSAHFHLQDTVPGDGCHIWMTALLGINRARAYMLSGEVITAEEAHRWGLVKEVVPKEKVLERAWEIARQIAEKSDSTLRFTRAIMVQPLKKQTLELLRMGVVFEALGALGRNV
ncbi:enoyl-CoA hydratase/isomerase family protein [Nocardia aurantia]|uniref:6-oxocamphor hydrolase n=1 Tax=Nocardia aurantia TaxID=2585199 RepID=A0A7K0E1E8_9NOCA|nr:enoyl-CoA hydratase/isomerase family protein [Nocardia aurantia]MQY31825.1 6-oxocamphor hydrolase [Nocardia aurantia]